MFSTWKQRLMLGVYVLLLLSVPVGAYLASQIQNPNASAHSNRPVQNPLENLKPLTSTPSANTNLLLNLPTPEPLSTPGPSSDVTYGPTLNLKVILEGRPQGKMHTKLFVGIAKGTVTNLTAPQYLLSFNIDLPDSGAYQGLSLAGLNPGTTYSAILKGPAQVATSSAFTMSPSASNLNQGNPITLLTGDLNEDNVVNSADYAIAKAAYGTTSSSPNWNENVDFNLDGVVNSLDLAILLKNINVTGQSGVWQSTTPPPASGSASPSGGSSGGPNDGYWMWVPKF